MISAAALVALALTIVGGSSMAAALSAPIVALFGVHSLAAAGGIIGGLSTVQKIYAADLVLKVADRAVKTGKRLSPLHEAIIAKLQADAALPHGDVVARHVGGPIGWSRTPVVFVYDPEARP